MAPVSIQSNVASLTAQRRLRESTFSLSRTSERLSSGQRITRVGDDAAGLSVAASLNVDGRVFTQAVRNVNDAAAYLAVAEGASRELSGVLMRLSELAVQASNGTLSNIQRGALDQEAQALVGEYNRIVSATEFNGRQLFEPASRDLDVQAGYGVRGTVRAVLGLVSTAVSVEGDGTFQARQPNSTGVDPWSVTTADFNGDGRPDIANIASGSVNIFLGNGDGSFQPQQSYAAGSALWHVTSADFNGDGIPDLAAVDLDSFQNSVNVLLGNGNGSFQAPQTYSAGVTPWMVVAADFDGDGVADLATADAGDGTVSVLLGNGNGSFQPRQSYSAGTTPWSVAAADFDGDGALDLVSADSTMSTVSVRLGNGDGTFRAAQAFATGAAPVAMTAADFNGDGVVDIATADAGASAVGVLLGNGDGTFQAPQAFAAGMESRSIATGDFNGDGELDLVTADNDSNELSVLLGDGDGTFQPRQSYAAGSAPRSVAVADFDGDGALDLVAADSGSDTLSVFLGNGTPSAITTSVAIGAISGVSVATRAAALAAQGQIDASLDTVNLVSGIIGASMSRLEAAARTLSVGAENFRDAEGRIVDADIAEDSSALVRGQILQQAGVAALAQANQLPSLALALLSGSSDS